MADGAAADYAVLVREVGGTYSRCANVGVAVGGTLSANFTDVCVANGLADYSCNNTAVWSNISLYKPLRIDYDVYQGQQIVSLAGLVNGSFVNNTLVNPSNVIRGENGLVLGSNMGDFNVSDNLFLYADVETSGVTVVPNYCVSGVGNFYTSDLSPVAGDCGPANVTNPTASNGSDFELVWKNQHVQDYLESNMSYRIFYNNTGNLTLLNITNNNRTTIRVGNWSNGNFTFVVIPFMTFMGEEYNATYMNSSRFELNNNAPVGSFVSPANHVGLTAPASVTFSCSFTDDNGLVNVTLYHNYTNKAVLTANTTVVASGVSFVANFSLTGFTASTVQWSCNATDLHGLSTMVTGNRSVVVSALSTAASGASGAGDGSMGTSENVTQQEEEVVGSKLGVYDRVESFLLKTGKGFYDSISDESIKSFMVSVKEFMFETGNIFSKRYPLVGFSIFLFLGVLIFSVFSSLFTKVEDKTDAVINKKKERGFYGK